MDASFYFKFGQTQSKYFDLHGDGSIKFNLDEIILDPSMLFFMTNNEIKESMSIYYLPDDLIRLIELARESNDNEYKIFLRSFLRYFGNSDSENLEANNWTLFYKNYNKLKIIPITEEDIEIDNDSFYDFYLTEFSDHDFYISLSPFKNFLGSVIGKVMEFSRKKGKLILSKTKKLANKLSGKILALELPKKLDDLASAKQSITEKIFHFKGVKGTKAFIGISLSVGGFFSASPVLGGVGLLFAFTDP